MKYGARDTTFDYNGSPIDQVRAFPAFGSSRPGIDASVYGEEWTSEVGGLKDGDEVAMVFAFDPASTTQNAIQDDYDNSPDDVQQIGVTHPSGMSKTINCILRAVAWDTPLDGLLAMNVTIKIVNPGVVDGS